MAIVTTRFKISGPTTGHISDLVAGAVVTKVGEIPVLEVDADSSVQDDLDAAMESLGFQKTTQQMEGPGYVLQFDGTPACNVSHDFFWDQAVIPLPNFFFWETWLKVMTTTGYIVSDGYGGIHSLLWGPTGGNVWNATDPFQFGGDDGGGNVWHHEAVGLLADAAGNLLLARYINGICDGIAPFIGPRTTTSPASGGGVLYVGGSTHLNLLEGRLAMLRGFDTHHPYAADSNGKGFDAFYPQRSFGSMLANYRANFLTDYTKRALIVSDDSDGYDGGSGVGTIVKHPGRLGAYSEFPGFEFHSGASPKWITDPTCPLHNGGVIPSIGAGFAPPVIPPGAKIFDSFSRDDSTIAQTTDPTLGDTEGGSLGVQTWQYGGYAHPYPFTAAGANGWALFNGRAVRTIGYPGVAWTVGDSPDMDVRVTRRLGTWGSGETGIAFRVGDGDNFLYAMYLRSLGKVTIGKVVAGVQTGWANSAGGHGDLWTQLRVTTVGDDIEVFLSPDGVVWTSILTRNDASLNTNEGAGLFYWGFGGGYGNTLGLTSVARFDDFTVF